MSLDHSYIIGSDDNNELMLNISGLDSCEKNVADLSANFYALCSNTGVSKFTCKLNVQNLRELHHHLSKYSIICDHESLSTGRFVEVKGNYQEVINILENTDNASLIMALQHLVSKKLTHNDINTILGRKDSLAEYEDMLKKSDQYNEPDWQKFFERNEWIFGYGLTYKYLKILQREAHVSKTDLNGANDVITDFLMSDSRYTKIVELKTPTTKLFTKRQGRSDTWFLSSELTDAVSQIIAQKANWEIESQTRNYTADGNLIREETFDAECILIIGSLSSIEGTDKEKAIKRKTLELYRRNLKNIDILFYDELLERSRYIVKSAEVIEDKLTSTLVLPE
ncbi:Shedu immune nuclease family protein [Pantoea sp. NPDC088449]|uniref:Shedu immune nuclease family protein n=1 Tax=Pantoea sp. NPDC088449 TaxID=3364392 RepID=UPI003802F0C4